LGILLSKLSYHSPGQFAFRQMLNAFLGVPWFVLVFNNDLQIEQFLVFREHLRQYNREQGQVDSTGSFAKSLQRVHLSYSSIPTYFLITFKLVI